MNSSTPRRGTEQPPYGDDNQVRPLWAIAEDPSPQTISDEFGPDYDRIRQLLGTRVCRQLGIYELPTGFVLSVVIPIYNELTTIEEVVRRVRGTGLPIEMVLVDDGSSDGTRDILNRWRDQPDMKIIFHDKNQGKGAACAPDSLRPRATW